MLSDDEILRRLRTIRNSPILLRYGRKITSINGIAQRTGLSRVYLYDLINGNAKLSHPAKRRISDVMTCKNGGWVREEVPSAAQSIPVSISVLFTRSGLH